jgi:hypothetical protein
VWSHRPRSASRTPHPDPPSLRDRSIKPDEMEPSYLTASRALNTACPIPPAPCEVVWHGGTASSPRCSGDPTSAVRRCRDRQDEPAWLSLGAIGHRLLARTFAPAPHASAEHVSETRSVSGRRSLELTPAVRCSGATLIQMHRSCRICKGSSCESAHACQGELLGTGGVEGSYLGTQAIPRARESQRGAVKPGFTASEGALAASASACHGR